MAWYDIFDPGDLFGFQQDSRISRAHQALKEAQAKAEDNSAANQGLYKDYYDKVDGEYSGLANKFNTYLQNLENTNAETVKPFQFGESVDDYYSKAADMRVKNAMNNLRESSDIFSSDYQNAMAAKQQAMATEEWDKAYERYNQARAQSLNEQQFNANAAQQNYNNQFNKNQTMLNLAQNAKDNVINAYGNYVNNLANQNNIDTQNYANTVQQMAANANTHKSLLGRLFG